VKFDQASIRSLSGVGADHTINDENGVFVMLVLTRKSNESIAIGGYGGPERMLKVTVICVNQGRVKLGIDVADDVPVHRWEVWERIRAGAKPDDLAFGDNGNAAQ
jgi:carbon storage regulator CsrA